ncbi:hypothetical protein SLA2020_305630 [Shorea laevis]
MGAAAMVFLGEQLYLTRKPKFEWRSNKYQEVGVQEQVPQRVSAYVLIDNLAIMLCVVAAFGSGAVFSFASGIGGPNSVTNVLTAGLSFALIQGCIFKSQATLNSKQVQLPHVHMLLSFGWIKSIV